MFKRCRLGLINKIGAINSCVLGRIWFVNLEKLNMLRLD